MLFKLFIVKVLVPPEKPGKEVCFIYIFAMKSKLLGSSPLGIAFFSSEAYGGGAQGPNDGGGNSRFIKPHEDFTEKDVQSFAQKDTDRTARLSGVISVGESPAKSSSGNSSSPTTSTTTKKLPPDEKAKGENITMDFGLGYQTFGDKRTIFTNNEDMPNTFYVYYDRKTNSLLNNNSRGGKFHLLITSKVMTKFIIILIILISTVRYHL